MKKSFADRRRAVRAWLAKLLYDVLCGVLVHQVQDLVGAILAMLA